MGLYDSIFCEMPLPDGYVPNRECQTKALDNELATYRITPEGRLVREKTGTFRENRPEPPVDMEHHGYIVFCDIDGDANADDATWHEYQAKFTDGQCVEIALIENRKLRDR